jgi:hypothetical protein
MQDTGSIGFAVVIYSLSKIIERRENMRLKNWNSFVKKISSYIKLSILALSEDNESAFESYLEAMRKSMSTLSINLKPYIQDVLRKAAVNKASRIYEHGISLGRTAKLLGVSQWELTQYAGQSEKISEIEYNKTLDIQKRAKMALEFFA